MLKTKKQIHKEIYDWFDKRNQTQQELSCILGIKQGQLSKILNGKFVGVNSKAIVNICKYAKINREVDYSPRPEASEIIMSALRNVWDGTSETEMKIAKFITALKDLV